jgi:hypothetical protein
MFDGLTPISRADLTPISRADLTPISRADPHFP